MDRRVDERKRRGSLFLGSVRDATGVFSFFQRGKNCDLFSIQIWVEINLYTSVSSIFFNVSLVYKIYTSEPGTSSRRGRKENWFFKKRNNVCLYVPQVARGSTFFEKWSKFVESEPGVDFQCIHMHLFKTMDLLGYSALGTMNSNCA